MPFWIFGRKSERAESRTREELAKFAQHVAMWSIFGGVLLGVAGINVYASQFSRHEWLSVAGTGFLVAGASFGVGGILGVIFGVPRRQSGPPKAGVNAPPYEPNTNLEQISDWLTKILIGAGLTQIAQLPELGDRLSKFLAPGLGDRESTEAFVSGLVIYFAVAGFMLCYLWTSLYLPGALADSYRQGQDSGEREDGSVPPNG